MGHSLVSGTTSQEWVWRVCVCLSYNIFLIVMRVAAPDVNVVYHVAAVVLCACLVAQSECGLCSKR